MLTPNQTVFAKFEQRCRELGVLAWWCDDQGAIIAEPVLADGLDGWLGAPLLRHRVESTVRAMFAAGQAQQVCNQVLPGATVVALAADQSRHPAGAVAVLILTDAFAETDSFRAACAEVATDPDNTALLLSPWMRHNDQSTEAILHALTWMQQDMLALQRARATLDGFSENLLQSYEQTHLLFRLARLLNARTDPIMIMKVACQQLLPVMPFAWVAMKFGSNRSVLAQLANRLMVAGNLPCDEQMFDKLAHELVEHSDTDNWTRLLDPADDALAELARSEIVAEPIAHNGKPIGVLLAGNKGGDDPDVSSVETQFLEAAADFLGVFHENVARFHEERALFLGTLQALTASIDAKDRYTCGHSERVAHLTWQLATQLGMTADEVETARIAGLVHDVGKIGVPEAVLCKPGRLDDHEFAQIKKHPVIGYNILKDITRLSDVLPGVLYHHERWDGRGYPEGLAGESIPLLGRIIGVADTFDAMSSNRAYRAALQRDEILAELKRSAGSQLDAMVVKTFLSLDLTDYDAMLAKHQTEARSEALADAAAAGAPAANTAS